MKKHKERQNNGVMITLLWEDHLREELENGLKVILATGEVGRE